MIGPQLSHYEILSRISESAAGSVYKARDAESGRMVSIRELGPALTATPEQRQHLQEAVAAASKINHPNLARIYEFTSIDGQDFIVSELVEGETLDGMLRSERLHRRDLFSYARQIVGALDAVHQGGLVHAGLNGGNVVLDSQRRMKVLDCGLARLLRLDKEELPTEVACFCSPEQIEGDPLDERSDVFSFGVLLYYMTTRRRPFRRDTFEDTLQAVLKDDPKPLETVTRHAPRGIEKILKQCLRKKPGHRYQHIADLEPLIDKLALQHESNSHSRSSKRSADSSKLPWILAGAAAVAVIGAVIFWFANLSLQRKEQDLTQITLETGFDGEPSLSSSARQVAYASDVSGEGNLDIWVQTIGSQRPVRITNHTTDDHEPSISPDGSTVAFRSERDGGGLYLAPASSGAARLLVTGGRSPRYSPDGRWIAYWTGESEDASKLFVMPAEGGAARPIAADFLAAAHPIWSSDSRNLLFVGRKDATMNAGDVEWYVASVEPGVLQSTGGCRALRGHGLLRNGPCPAPRDWKGKGIYFSLPDNEGSQVWRAEILPSRDITAMPVQVTSGAGIHAQPAVTEDGKIVFSKQALNVDIWGVPLHANDGRLGGEWKKLTNDPAPDTFPSLSANGVRLLFQSNRDGVQGAWLLNLNVRVATPVSRERQDLLWPRISPDGSLFSYAEENGGRYDRLVMPVTGGTAEPLCQNCGRGMDWAPDAKSALVEDAASKGIMLVKPGSKDRVALLQRAGSTLVEPRYSPDRRSIAFVEKAASGASRILIAPLRGETAPPQSEWRPLTKDTAWEAAPQWSPDSKLVYFISSRDGRRCIWAKRLDDAVGQPFGVAHFHDSRRSPANTALNADDLFIAADQIVIGIGELSGSLWMLTPHQ